MNGLFITFEGIDGSGKSTQIELVRKYLLSRGYDVYVTREPGGCPLSEAIRAVLLDVANKGMDPHAEALLYAAARAELVSSVLVPLKASGTIILCDRYFDSSVAYQAYGRGLGEEFVYSVNKAALSMMPDLTIYLRVSSEQSEKRIAGQNRDKDRLELEGMDFFNRVLYGFDRIAEKEPERVMSIDAQDTIECVFSQIKGRLDALLSSNGE